MARLIVVSNRLPVSVKVTNGRSEISPSAGGLATGLKGPHERSGGIWIGWPGEIDKLDADALHALDAELARMRCVPCHLTVDEVKSYYNEFSNGVLWPLFHYLVDLVPRRNQNWESYLAVNRKFADCVCQHYRPGDHIWVHDYQLALVPGLLRERLPNARIGFFLHIPFPDTEIIRILPWRSELLIGLLGADLIGFHTLAYARHFANSLIHILGLIPDIDHVRFAGRTVRFGAFPMGIDAEFFAKCADEPDVVAAVDRIRAEGAGRQLILGVDRLDYTKGIPRRLLAIEHLLEDDPSLPGKIRFVQVAVPSRTQVDQYERFTSEVNELVGRINGRYGTPSAVPIHYLYRNLDQRELTALYRAAEVMLVTPLRDGMNLVAKEYVASHGDDRGVLILSEFAGAASELGEAISVNPYDIDAMAGAIRTALAMPEEERRFRMQALRQRVARFNVHAWAEHFLATLQDAPPALQGKANALTQDEMTRIVTELSCQPQLTVFLDYDGTLVPYAPRPELAVPDEPVLALLASLSAQPGVAVHVISGRTSAFLESWLGRLPIGLHAEHGLWSRSASPGGPWTLNAKPSVAWKERVLPILHEFTLRTPGSRIEEKDYSIAWHYRIGDPEYNEWQARELKIHLSQVLTNTPVAILSGEKVIELQPHDANKGRAALSLLGPNASPQSIMAAGDDETDERMFMALPNGAVTIHVGPKHSIARHNVVDVATFRHFLRMLVDRLGTRHT